jgi:hypothetical protein
MAADRLLESAMYYLCLYILPGRSTLLGAANTVYSWAESHRTETKM